MNFRSDHNSRGFTLIEIIVTLVIIAVMGTMTYTYFGQAFLQSVNPILRLQKSVDLHKTMANITADYNVYPKWRSGAVYTPGSKVIPSNPNRRYYTCPPGGGGTSSSTEPDWLTSGPTYTEATGVKWTDSGSLRTLPLYSSTDPLTYLKSGIGAEDTDQNNAYGKYHVVKNRFTQFVSDIDQDNDSSGTNKILKVTLKNENGETLTSLFFSD
jgi:prepilin-type N-terminal cleavage/methylation domain-containing protein